MPFPTAAEFEDAKKDLDALEGMVNSAGSVPTRLSGTKQSISQVIAHAVDQMSQSRASLAALAVSSVAASSAAFAAIGFAAPDIYAGSLSINNGYQTIERSGVIYAPKPSELPFTTTGAWSGGDENKFFVLSQSDSGIELALGRHLAQKQYQYSHTAAGSSHPGIVAGYMLTGNYFDDNEVQDSGAGYKYTGATVFENAGHWPFTDGYFYNAEGKKFEFNGAAITLVAFGAVPGTDCTAAFRAVLAYIASVGGGVIEVGMGTYGVIDIELAGVSNLIIRGVGSKSILDFAGSSNASAFRIGWDIETGGCKKVSLKDFSITDSSVVSGSENLLSIESGLTGSSPSTTTGFISLTDINFLEFNTPTGGLALINNASHVNFKNVTQPWEQGYRYGLSITNSLDINTGVMSFENCTLRGNESALYIHARTQLLDTITFTGCGFFSKDLAAARAAIRLRGENSTVAGVVFTGCHMESRNNAAISEAILLEGKVKSCMFNGMHISAGAGVTPQATYGVRFSNDPTTNESNFRSIAFKSTEFLRVSDSGYCFRFDGDVTTHPSSPIEIGSFWLNSTSPDFLDIAEGVNSNQIMRSISSNPIAGQQATGRDALHVLDDVATPSVEGGERFEFQGERTATTITDFTGEYKGQVIDVVNNSASSMTIEYDYFKIRLVDDRDMILNKGESASFIRLNSPNNHWLEIGSSLSRLRAASATIDSESTTISGDVIKASSIILFTPANQACAQAMSGDGALYVSNVTNGSFKIKTANGLAVAATCAFNYSIWND